MFVSSDQQTIYIRDLPEIMQKTILLKFKKKFVSIFTFNLIAKLKKQNKNFKINSITNLD